VNQLPLCTLCILIALIDLNESATADDIFANIKKRGYANAPIARDLSSNGLRALLLAGHLELISETHGGPNSREAVCEVDYSAYILLQSLCATESVTELSAVGLARLKEVEIYIDEIVSDGAADRQKLLAETVCQGKSLADASVTFRQAHEEGHLTAYVSAITVVIIFASRPSPAPGQE